RSADVADRAAAAAGMQQAAAAAARARSFLFIARRRAAVFARQAEDEGANPIDAAVEAARVRLRPILMTSFAFILGVVPLMLATGAGAEMRQSLGTAVFFGMLGVTIAGLIFTPTFYYVCRFLAGATRKHQKVDRTPPDTDGAVAPQDTQAASA
ncbi:MAG: efflux RND transporter permease subunit, partial [Pseudomonadota bacterium]